MPRLLILTLALALAVAALIGSAPATTPSPAQPVASKMYGIDNVHSTALFRVHHLGAGQFWGRFNTLEGGFSFDGTAEGLSIDVSIPIESIDTNNEGLDRHLKSPDFFNAREYERMSFKSKSAEKVSDTRYRVTGTLSIRNIEKEITTDVEWTGSNKTRMGDRCGIEATFTINRSDFGVMYGVENKMLGDEVRIIVGIEGVIEEAE